jgi:uncharacterized membrane protein
MWKFVGWSNALICVGTLLAAWANFRYRSKRKQHVREWLVLIGIIVSAVGGLLASFQQATYEQRIVDMTSGGDSFCFLVFFQPLDSTNSLQLAIKHQGTYPLQNVHFVMQDIETMRKALPNIPQGRELARAPTVEEIQKLSNYTMTQDVGLLGPPGTIIRFEPLISFSPDREQVTYSIHLYTYTQFQEFHQHLRLQKVNRRWTQAYRVHKRGSGKDIIVLHESIDGDFPRNPSGKVTWPSED